MKYAAVLLIRNSKGEVLTVSRKDNPDLIGLPGGKMDPDDYNLWVTATRELHEETGLSAYDIKQIFVAKDLEYETACFTARVYGKVHTSETGIVRWSPVKDLLDPAKCPFYEYNRQLMNVMNEVML